MTPKVWPGRGRTDLDGLVAPGQEHRLRAGRGCRARRPVMQPLEPRLLLDGGHVTGCIWEDFDGDGLRGPGEPGVNGWTVELLHAVTGELAAAATTASVDLNGDGGIDPQTETGAYEFVDVPPGTYELRCATPSGWYQTSPRLRYSRSFSEQNTLYHPNELIFDFTGALLPAGEATLTVTATGDLDGSDEYLEVIGEGVALGRVFEANGRAYQPATQPLEIDQATLASLAADGTVSLSVRPSWQVSNLGGLESITVDLSYDAVGRYPVTMAADTVAEGLDFGVFALGEVCGVTWHDIDRDGVRDGDEPGVNSWTVRLLDGRTGEVLDAAVTADVDLDGDGDIDPYAERGVYVFEALGPGPFELRTVARYAWESTAPAGGAYSVALTSGESRSGVDFGSFRLAEVHGQVWDDLNGDGLRDAGESGLDGWVVQLIDADSGQTVAVAKTRSVDADADGQVDPQTERGLYDLRDIFPADYEVALVVPDHWAQTLPAEPAWTLELTDGRIASGIDFACQAEGCEVAGRLWVDVDGDGLRGPDEPGGDGIVVELIDAETGLTAATTVTEGFDVNGDGQLDPLTESGHYRFTGVAHGGYELRVRVPQEWHQTAPAYNFSQTRSESNTLCHPNVLSIDFAGALPPASDATLTLSAVGDLDAADEYLQVLIEGTVLADVFVTDGQQYQPVETVITVPRAELAAAAADGTVSVTVRPSGQVADLGGSESIAVELAYVSTGAYAVALEAGQVAEGFEFALAPPPVNGVPMLTSIDTFTGGVEDEPFVITYDALAAAGDQTDPEGQTITFRVDVVSSGTLTKAGRVVWPEVTLLGPGQSLTWLPDPDANGALDAFRVRAWDGLDVSVMAVLVRVEVAAVNDAPTLTIVDTLIGSVTGEPLVIAYEALMAAGDAADVEGDLIRFRVESVTSGTLTKAGQPVTPATTLLAPGESLAWQAAPDAGGIVEAFRLKAWDGQAASAEAVPVRVNVDGWNSRPRLTAITTLTGAVEDVGFPVTHAALLAASDAADVDGQRIRFRIEWVIAGAVRKGGQEIVPGVTLLAPGESVTWQPPGNESGAIEAFAVVAWDGLAASAPAVPVRVEVEAVNDAPEAVNDTAVATEGTPALTPDVLANDTDAEGDPLTVTAFTQPVYATVTYEGDGIFRYVPLAGFHGRDAFTYTITDGRGGQDIGIVIVTVAGANGPPSAEDDAAWTFQDTPVTTPDVLANDSDPDGDPLEVSDFTQPDHGSVSHDGNGTFTYTPQGGFTGQDAFTYTASDGNGGEDTATVFVTVAAVGDAPVAADDGYGTDENTALVVAADAGVLANDVAAGGEALTAALVDGPAHGTLNLAADGSFTYTPAADFSGADTFTYTASDGHVHSNIATVTIIVDPEDPVDPPDPPPGAPTAHGRTVLMGPVGSVEIVLSGSDDDTPVGDLAYAISDWPVRGVLTLAGRIATYAPQLPWHGDDPFSFTVQDAGGLTSRPAVVSVLVPLAIDARHKAAFSDATGDLVTVSLKGPGLGLLYFDDRDGGDLSHVSLSGTTKKSSLTVRAKGRATSAIGSITVGDGDDANGMDCLKSISAKRIDLLGDVFVEGGLGRLVLGNVEGPAQQTMSIGPGSGKGVKLTFARVADLTLDSAMPIRSIVATEWLDGEGAPDVISAPSLGRLKVRGDRRGGIDGDFQAGLALDGSDHARLTLGNVRGGGDLTDAHWDVAGDVGAIRAAGRVDDWALNVQGNVRSLTLGDVAWAEVDVAGDLTKAAAKRWLAGGLAARTLRSLTLRGDRRSGVQGDFGADLLLRGVAGSGKPALGSARIAGGLLSCEWKIAGQAGRLPVKGAAEHSTVRCAGGILGITLGGCYSSDFLAGVGLGSPGRHATEKADFENEEATIRAVAVRGWRLPKDDPTRFVADSNFTAATIGTVRLTNAAGGGACGLFVLDGEAAIASVQHRDTLNPEDSWTWRPGEPLPVVGSVMVNVIG